MLYIIECRDIIELYEEKELAGRADSITIIANEHDPFDWYGSMTFRKDAVDVRMPSFSPGMILTVTFSCNNKDYVGRIRTTGDLKDTGISSQVRFNGAGLLQSN